MRSLLIGLLFIFSSIAIWSGFVITSTTNGWFRDPVSPRGDTSAFMQATENEIDKKSNGNLVFTLIQSGKVFDEYSTSIGQPVDGNTIFQVASLGKWVAAVGIMTLVESDKLDLDKPVSTYLTRWQLPPSQFDNNGVTVRRLLSHTAGLTDGLGHDGFAPGEKVQPLTHHLTQALDADEGVSGKVAVGIEPGSEFKYSGGGYNLLQLLVEEVSGISFKQYMQQAVFDPLNMINSGYDVSLNDSRLATNYNDAGEVQIYRNFTSLAATGLYTTTNDLAKFLTAHLPGLNGEAIGRGVLSEKTLKAMRQPHASTMGMDIWGLGTMLYSSNNQNDFIIGHGGQSSPAINATARLNPTTGNGIIVLQTGNRNLAANLASEWSFWETSQFDLFMVRNSVGSMLKSIGVGSLLIIISSLIIMWRKRKVKTKEQLVIQS